MIGTRHGATQLREAAPLAELMRRWASATTGAERCAVAVATPNGGGRLAPIAESGPTITAGGRRSRLRRDAFRTGRPRRIAHGGLEATFLPVAVGGEPIAVLEIELPDGGRRLDDACGELLTGLLAIVLTTDRRSAVADAAVEVGLALAAHELTGPLAAIRAVVDLVLDGELARSDLRQASWELDRLTRSVWELLQHGVRVLAPSFHPVDLAALAHDVRRSLDLQAPDRVRLQVGGPVVVSGDPVQLHSALSNLVRNGLDHSPPREPVELRVRRKGAAGMVDVIDRGPGIPGHLVEQIFDPLVRGNGSRSPAGGHGLGLFLTKRVIEAHGGTIEVSSEPGHTAFRVRMPLRVRAA